MHKKFKHLELCWANFISSSPCTKHYINHHSFNHFKMLRRDYFNDVLYTIVNQFNKISHSNFSKVKKKFHPIDRGVWLTKYPYKVFLFTMYAFNGFVHDC